MCASRFLQGYLSRIIGAVSRGIRIFSGAVETGGDAKRIIQESRVEVNGEPCTMRGKKLRPGDRATIDGETELIVV